MIVAQKDVLNPQLEILSQLFADWRGAAGVIQIVGLESRKDDFIVMAIPLKGAKHGMRLSQLIKKVKRERDILRRAQERIVKGDIEQALGEVAFRNGSVWLLRPG